MSNITTTQNFDWLTPVMALIGVFVGGVLSFLTTLSIRKIEDRRSIDLDRIKNIYVPLCAAIENMQKLETFDPYKILTDFLSSTEWLELRRMISSLVSVNSRRFLLRSEMRMIEAVSVAELALKKALHEVLKNHCRKIVDRVIGCDSSEPIIEIFHRNEIIRHVIEIDMKIRPRSLLEYIENSPHLLRFEKIQITVEDTGGIRRKLTVQPYVFGDASGTYDAISDLSDRKVLVTTLDVIDQRVHDVLVYISNSIRYFDFKTGANNDYQDLLHRLSKLQRSFIRRIDRISIN